ncbi:MAG: GtrA family protein [Bacillota bacterium]|nr:GtrA family protein [Bacillota bacterium]
MDRFKRMKDSKAMGELLRYLVTGGSAFLLEYALYLLLYRAVGLDYAFAMTIVYSALFVITFVVTRKWTFKSKASAKRQLVLYLMLFLFNLLIGNYLMMRWLVGAGMSAELAPFIKTAMITCWNFLIYKYVIYV